MEESSTTTSEAPFDATFDSYEEKLFEERSEKLLHKISSTTTIKTTTAFYETSSEEDEKAITTTITPELSTTTLSEGKILLLKLYAQNSLSLKKF